MVHMSRKLRKFGSRLTLTALLGAMTVACFPASRDAGDDDPAPPENNLHEQSQSLVPTMYAVGALDATDRSQRLG